MNALMSINPTKGKLLNLLIICILPSLSYGQNQSLDLLEAYSLAEKNYPLIKKSALIDQRYDTNIELLKKERIPTVEFIGQGQLQTENISIGTEFPNNPNAISLPLETFNTYLNLNYNLYDGGYTKAKKLAESSLHQLNQEQVNVSLRKVKDQINNLFLNVNLLRQQHLLLISSEKDIQTSLELLEAGYKNGTVLESEISKLKVRQIELSSESIKLLAEIEANILTMSKITGVELDPEVELIIPPLEQYYTRDLSVSRPEIQLFSAQKDYLESQLQMIKSNNTPILALYGQGGVGYPNPLNFPDISTAFYALGGIRVKWNLFNWGGNDRRKQQIYLQQAEIDVDQETFEFDIQNQKERFLKTIDALEDQIGKDREIVKLQQEITQQSEVQLTEGIIRTNDYLIEANNELKARQQLELHILQKQKLQIEYLTLFGKL